jgi:small subunit ribosomal protein S19
MSRSKWKSLFAGLNSSKSVKRVNRSSQMGRNLKITPFYLGQTFKIHNGKGFVKLQVTDGMIGHKFGEFVFTRAKYEYKRRKKRRKMKKKLKKKA